MFRKKQKPLFQALIIVYSIAFVGLMFSWNTYTFGSANVVLNQDTAYHDHIQFNGPLLTKENKTNFTPIPSKQVLNPLYIGGKNCPVKHIVSFLDKQLQLSAEPVCSWLISLKRNGNFVGYGNQFAHLHDVVLSPQKAEGRIGGENMSYVWKQKEEDEYLKLKTGYFSLRCNMPVDYEFTKKSHLSEWKKAVECDPKHNVDGLPSIKGFTIAVKRYEYVNLYHTMTDYYNAFLMMLIFNKNPDNTTILWIDSHPSGTLDEPWKTLFSRTIRAGMLKEPTVFEDMVWNIMGYNSLLLQHDRPFTPYLEQFREFFLTRHGVSSDKKLDCNHLNITFIWRRDYIAHPRNPSGMVKRKIQNEEEILTTIQSAVPGHSVKGVQLDPLSMKQQLDLISHTDILLGMHGAGLTHTLFLPKHGGLIEFYPTYWSQSNKHFRALATWRGLQYRTWQNHESSNERAKYHTYIPPQTVLHMFQEVKKYICEHKSR